MKIRINPNQLYLLSSKFHIIEGQGMSQNGKNLINESRLREYIVRILVHGQPAEIRIGAYSRASALSIARLMFPKVNVTGSITAL